MPVSSLHHWQGNTPLDLVPDAVPASAWAVPLGADRRLYAQPYSFGDGRNYCLGMACSNKRSVVAEAQRVQLQQAAGLHAQLRPEQIPVSGWIALANGLVSQK